MGDNPAGATWSDIYRAERDGLTRLAYLMTGSQPVAEDLVQDCFIKVMNRLQPADEPGAYLRRSVINACYSWQRRNARRAARQQLIVAGESASPGDRAGDVELWDALNRLPPRRRTVLVLRYYLDLTEAQTAAALDWRVGTVKSATSRALADLRRIVER